MYLSNLNIKNFRNFDELDMRFSPGLNVIVGENNIGKTNLFDAIRIALGAASNQGDLVRVSKEDLSKDKYGKILDTSFLISLTFSGLSEDERGEFIDILELSVDDPAKSTAAVHFEWTWSEELNRGSYRRWGGPRSNTDSIPEDVLQAIQVTLLHALRDALSGLQPGRQSRLGRVLKVLAKADDKSAIEQIMNDANTALEANSLVKEVSGTIQKALTGASGPVMSQKATISTSPAEFERIANNLRLALQRDQEPGQKANLEELWFNGLGYNNLLFIATVLSELEASKNASLAMLLVEEPEAHLHPQLQTMLADYLAGEEKRAENAHVVQTLVTTHSPTIAAHVDPNCLIVLHHSHNEQTIATNIAECGLTERERKQLQRMLDVTKATMLFSRGVLLVEGLSESILLPVLARREGINLQERAISVVPICGVDFNTFGKLFSPDRISLKLAIITDGDPKAIVAADGSGPKASSAAPKSDSSAPKADAQGGDKVEEQPDEQDGDQDDSWRHKVPEKTNGKFAWNKRVLGLVKEYTGNNCVKVFNSNVTLEYDFAEAAKRNVDIMCDAWHDCYTGTPRTFNRRLVADCGDKHDEKVLTAWRGICLAKPMVSKPEFAQSLAIKLDQRDKDGNFVLPPEEVVTPAYLRAALQHVVEGVKPDAPKAD